MSKTEYVLVPKRLLEQLEEDRNKMYRVAAGQPLTESVLVSYNLTSTMWKLGNTVFKPYNAEQPQKMSVASEVDYKTLFEELLEVTENSDGVTGLHLNGNIATWDELENNNWLPLLKEWKENQHE